MVDHFPSVAVVMGSRSDWTVMREAVEVLDMLGVSRHAEIVSAHRTPRRLVQFAEQAQAHGFRVIIAGAGGAAHLPGMIAALTPLPVLGVPVPATVLEGVDSLLSIVQMPRGVAVGTLAIGAPGAFNAGVLAAQILAVADADLMARLIAWRTARSSEVLENSDPESVP